MNAKDRTELTRIVNEFIHLRDAASSLVSELDSMKDEEQEKFDNLPEGIQDSERGERIQEAADLLDWAFSESEELIDKFDEVNNAINDILEY